MAKSPRMVPGAEARGLVAPRRAFAIISTIYMIIARRMLHTAASLDNFPAFPDHSADGTRVHVLDQTGEEGLSGKIRVVLLEVLSAGLGHLDGDELEAIVECVSDGRSRRET